MLVKVLGPGCKNCVALENATREAIDRLGLDATVEKVTDYVAIAGYGVIATPALVVDEKVVSSGRVLTPTRVGELLTAAAAR
ncbi:thioredoxin family protein [Nocardioides sp.]|uniref:thioredoxin family protein n=1 Tax=Nocardioides sp. TaxID=35761 RepID=UPI0037849DBE